MKKDVLSSCSSYTWRSGQQKSKQAARFTFPWSISPRQVSGTRKPRWEKTPSTQSWKTWKKTHLLKICVQKRKSQTTAPGKTIVKKLKSSGVPKCEIKNITGHTAAQGLDDYDSGDEREQQVISNIIDNGRPSLSRRPESAVSSKFLSINSAHYARTDLQLQSLQHHLEHCRL